MKLKTRINRVEDAILTRNKIILVGYSTEELENKKAEYLKKHPGPVNFICVMVKYEDGAMAGND